MNRSITRWMVLGLALGAWLALPAATLASDEAKKRSLHIFMAKPSSDNDEKRLPRTADTQRKWKKSTVERFERAGGLAAPGGSAAIPPTDCPPLPTQDCLDTWDEKSGD